MPDIAGEALFARFAFPPNALGHCGPPGSERLLETGATGRADDELRSRAREFDGAWPYLELIARAHEHGQPLAADVVSAYWLGAEALDAISDADLVETAGRHFGTQPGVTGRLVEQPDVATAGASHVFHVFVVYPWVGLLDNGSDVARRILDSCRIRWGTVQSVAEESVDVLSPSLAWDGAQLSLAPPRLATYRWVRGSHAFVRPAPGDEVALHWDWVCDRLTETQSADLARRTVRQLESTNRWLVQQRDRQE